MNQLVYPGIARILPCNFNNIFINIKTLNICFNVHADIVIGFFYRHIPLFFRYQIFPLLCRKLPIHARCNIRSHHCRFYRECTASTKRIYKNAVLMPRCQHNQRRRQRFWNRCFARCRTVSALMQWIPCRIQTNRNNILHNRDTQRIGTAILLEPARLVFLL